MKPLVRSVGAALALSLVAMACGNRSDIALIEEARAGSLAAAQAPAPTVAGQPANSSSQQRPRTTGGTDGVNRPADQPAPAAGPAAPADAPTAAATEIAAGVAEGAIETRFAPPGGNGGATDVGVTESEILIGNVADITGAVAGLFADVQKAAQAWELYFNTTVGTIWGRQVRLVPMDTQLTRNGNFSAYTELCNSAFMAAASMSAFDEGIVAPIRDCPGGFPDLRTATTNPEAQVVDGVFSTDSMKPNLVGMTELNYWKRQFPDAIAHSAYVFVDNNTTRAQTDLIRRASETIGYSWDLYEPVDLAAISYKTSIRKMKEAGVRFVTFMGAYQQVAKLAREMVEEEFH
ncbi:MAG: ABC transporter substrate-binding protein, partial [Nitriliruptorales bacterium]|nr:ABC transporter substrate-binding protein [Nitriliruptorales bacterium]